MEQSLSYLTEGIEAVTSEDPFQNRKMPIQFDPKSCEEIICIELKNNNLLYLRYKDTWTIKEVN